MTNTPVLPWCPDEPVRSIFSGRIRDGKFGNETAESYKVCDLSRRRLGFLHPFPAINYSDDSYRKSVNDSAAIEQYFKLHADQQPGYLNLIRGLLAPGRAIADCGCGGGALLDLVRKETSGRTVAIEPFAGYHRSLADRGNIVYSNVNDAVAAAELVDVALSFHVIEHVTDPVLYLSEIRHIVKPGGRLFVLTPNWDDFLMQADSERMEPFFYRRVHNYYFTAESLAWVGTRAGWSVDHEVFYHEFGMSNALFWLRDGRPSGTARMPGVTKEADTWWKAYLERSRQANNVGIVLRNGDA